jgi:hypothetical protein
MVTAVCLGIAIASSYARKAFFVPRESLSLDSHLSPRGRPQRLLPCGGALDILEDCMIRSLRYFKSDGFFLVLLILVPMLIVTASITLRRSGYQLVWPPKSQSSRVELAPR